MGNLSESVRALVEDITTATENRRAQLYALTAEARAARRQYQFELQQMSQSLREYFAANRTERATTARAQHQATRQFMSEIRSVHEGRRVTVSELRSDAYNSIKRFGLERQDMAKTVRERLSAASQALQETVQDIKHTAQGLVGEIVADRSQAQQIWADRLKKKVTPEAVAEPAMAEAAVAEVGVAEAARPEAAEVAVPPAVQDARPLPLEERVLEVIARHPHGIRLVDIGNDLGVDWRSLLGISRTIVEEDKVERIDNLYYPKGGGSQEAGEEA